MKNERNEDIEEKERRNTRATNGKQEVWCLARPNLHSIYGEKPTPLQSGTHLQDFSDYSFLMDIHPHSYLAFDGCPVVPIPWHLAMDHGSPLSLECPMQLLDNVDLPHASTLTICLGIPLVT